MIFSGEKKAKRLITEAFFFVPLPEHTVRITWLPGNNSAKPNAYIGMEGVAENIKPDGSFFLKTKTSSLIVGRRNAFEYINSRDYFNN
jgi:hypothetical protein